MIRVFGVIVLLILAAFVGYWHGLKATPLPTMLSEDPARSEPVRASPHAPENLPQEVVLLATILGGKRLGFEKETDFNDYYELCIAVAGGLGGRKQCSRLRQTENPQNEVVTDGNK